MGTDLQFSRISTNDLSSDINWAEYYPRLIALARRFVYRYQISCWHGQEGDIVEDVVQETIRRMIERIQKTERGEASPIDSLECMMAAIARNYVLDLRRHDHRVTRLASDDEAGAVTVDIHVFENMSEIATENVYFEWLFLQVASVVAHFPSKQRRAILIDLANRMSFNTHPTDLQMAFLTMGIDLQDYQQAPPENPVERARHASLVSLAYKRVTQFATIQEDALTA